MKRKVGIAMMVSPIILIYGKIIYDEPMAVLVMLGIAAWGFVTYRLICSKD